MQPMRPRFELELPFDSATLFARIEARLACEGCPCQASVVGRTVEVAHSVSFVDGTSEPSIRTASLGGSTPCISAPRVNE